MNNLTQVAEKIRRDHKAMVLELEEYARDCEVVLPFPIGIFRNRCPKCKSRLNLTKHSHDPSYMTASQIWEYRCGKCNYRYVDHRDFGGWY